MSRYQPGDDVIVDVWGLQLRGEIVRQARGWCTCIVETDPLADLGGVTPMIDPRATVCVPDARVRPLT